MDQEEVAPIFDEIRILIRISIRSRGQEVRAFDVAAKITIDLSTLTRNDWCYPMKNGKVISPFGGSRKNHAGIDIKTFAGDTIYAAFSGLNCDGSSIRQLNTFCNYVHLKIKNLLFCLTSNI